MPKPSIAPGAVIDGFTIGEQVHAGGMAVLWSVTCPGIDVPLLMKVPRTSEGEDPAAIVSFEMEQMILPRLSGPHVPQCFGTGDFARQAYVAMERIPGKTLYSRLDELPLPYEEVRLLGGKIATALADLRSDLFSLGVLLYFFTTGVRPFGESEPLRGMRRRLWRDPHPPRRLRADYPPWLQEIVLRCLEIEPVWRYPTAAQLAFDLGHPDQVRLTGRSERVKRDPLSTVWRRRFNRGLTMPKPKSDVAAHLASSPIVAVALDTMEGSDALNDAIRVAAEQVLATLPSARLACLNVLKLGRVTIDRTLDEAGNNKHIDRMVALQHWAQPLKLDEQRLTVHVLEAIDPASAILEFAAVNQVDHIVVGARQNSFVRSLLGSVSSKVAAEAPCTVTVVRPPRRAGREE